jgi:hypothetical protein
MVHSGDSSPRLRPDVLRGDTAELICALPAGGTIELYEPVGPAKCERCGSRADDICFRIARDGSVVDGGLCASCLAEVMTAARRR